MTDYYRLVTIADDVDDEILDLARAETDYTAPGEPIEWRDVWDAIDGARLADGTRLDLGPTEGSPAMKKMQRTIRAERAND